MPSHDHVTAGAGIYLSTANNRFSGGGGANFGYNDNTPDTGLRTGHTGGGLAHENRPPYRAVYFIKKDSHCKNSYEQ
jgi:hypothetical protein